MRDILLTEVRSTVRKKESNLFRRYVNAHNKWLNSLKERLSTPVPKNQIGKRRTDRKRKLPLKASGSMLLFILENSFTSISKSKDTNTLEIYADLSHPHAVATSNAEGSTDEPNWRGWTERELYSNKVVRKRKSLKRWIEEVNKNVKF